MATEAPREAMSISKNASRHPSHEAGVACDVVLIQPMFSWQAQVQELLPEPPQVQLLEPLHLGQVQLRELLLEPELQQPLQPLLHPLLLVLRHQLPERLLLRAQLRERVPMRPLRGLHPLPERSLPVRRFLGWGSRCRS